MDIRQCHGSMRHSRIVTFVPRYKVDNRTDHEVVFAQRYQIFDEVIQTQSCCACVRDRRMC